MADFAVATHTFVISDLHLADAEPPHPHNPLWKRFKRPRFFIDQTVASFLDHIRAQANGTGPVELVLNGDIFDFDSVMAMPKPPEPGFHLSWLERRRGLKPEEAKSRFKIRTILEAHAHWTQAVNNFLEDGHRMIFVIGNHDIELHWPGVQQDIIDRLGSRPDQIRFVEWFYVSNRDTLIEHGNQYDAYSLCSNPIHPVIRDRHGMHLRLPFGNLAGKFMLNGMGLMNPHIESSYIKDSLGEYLVFFFRYVLRTQPFLMWTWLWSAIVTLVVSVSEGFRPAMTDPLTVADRLEAVAAKANATPNLVLALRALHAHPAYYSPLQILQELWLDRFLVLGLAFFAAFQFFSFLNVFVPVSFWWFVVPLALLLPIPIFYARSVRSEVLRCQAIARESAPTAAKLARVGRVVHGHTHREMHQPPEKTNGVEYLNTGTWSPAFHDVECTKPFGRKCFAWIRPLAGSPGRTASLFEWKEHTAIPVGLES